MKKKRNLILIFMLFGSLFTSSGQLYAHIEKVHFLKGKVGERDLAVKMIVYDELPTRYINYFFQDDKRDKYLTATLENGFWDFKSPSPSNRLEESLKIKETQNSNWTGNWIDSLGKSWDVVLNPIIPDSIISKYADLPFIKELDAYEFYKLSNINFITIKTEQLTKNWQCDWVLEEQSGISFFRLKSNDTKFKTDSINKVLETIQLAVIQKCFHFNPEKVSTKTETELLYFTNQLVSFKIISKNTFKNQKTAQSRQFLTFDIKNATQIDLEDLLWFDKSAVKPSPTEIEKIYEYRKAVFAPKILNQLKSLYPLRMLTDSCDVNKIETWTLPAWALTNKGLALGSAAFDNCDTFEWAIIPYQKLKPYLAKSYALKAEN